MIGKTSIRQLYESKGPKGFARDICHLMGVRDQHGRKYINPRTGLQERRKPRDSAGREMEMIDPRQLSLKELYEGILREDATDHVGVALKRPEWHLAQQHFSLCEQKRMPLLEDTGAGAVGPSVFADINAFTAVVSGLLEISVMQGWEYPDFIMDDIMPDDPTRMFDGRKVIGSTEVGDVAQPRYPGEPTRRASFGERWITQPRTVEIALGCEVLQETVYLDLTGEVLQRANNVGYWVHRRVEMMKIDCFLGITNTYQYNGVAHNTFIQNGYYNNLITGNELLFWEQIQAIELLFRDMTDPATGSRVKIVPDSIYVNQDKLYTAQAVIGATELEYRGAPGSTTANQDVRRFKNVLRNYKIYTSPLVYQRMTDASGLNLSATTAGKYYYVWDSRNPPHKWASNWPMRTQQAAPNNIDMIDRGVVLFVKCDIRGIPMTYEPRRIVNSQP